MTVEMLVGLLVLGPIAVGLLIGLVSLIGAIVGAIFGAGRGDR